MFRFDQTDVTFDSAYFRFTGYPAVGSYLCGDVDAMTAQTLALLPRGRAWQTDESGPAPGSVLYGYWRSVAEAFAFINGRLCALHNEFFCATRSETDPEWMLEYGLPDDCDPFADVCVKVAATGGATCDYLTWVAARAGWAISCNDPCGAEAGCAEAGCAPAGLGAPAGTLIITIHAGESPAYIPSDGAAEAGCVEAGQPNRCDPTEPLQCLIERIAQAHLHIIYYIEE